MMMWSFEGRDERFPSFQPLKQHVHVFLQSTLSTSYRDLLRFCQSLLLLPHGQAIVERGFSVNKDVEMCNLLDKSLEVLRLICDKISGCGGVLKVPLTKELLTSAASVRSQYRLYLEQTRKKWSAKEGQLRMSWRNSESSAMAWAMFVPSLKMMLRSLLSRQRGRLGQKWPS